MAGRNGGPTPPGPAPCSLLDPKFNEHNPHYGQFGLGLDTGEGPTRTTANSLSTSTQAWAGWRGVGPVVRVMPSEPDGGVLPGGRTYTS